MPRAKLATVAQTDEIRSLTQLGYGPAQIYRELQKRAIDGGEHLLSKRTVERMCRKFAPQDSSEPWSLRDAEPEEARDVLEVLVDIFERTEGRVWLTKKDADWIAKIRAASPHLPSGFVYYYARLYQEIAAGDTRQLDLLVGLGLKPRLKDSTDQILRLMKDMGIVPGPVGSIDLAIPWSETHPARNPLDVSVDSKVTAKPADYSGQPETNHPDE